MKNTVKDSLDYTLFSWSKQAGLNPIHIDHAKGVYLYDTNGKKYIDFSSQLMNVNIGHGNQRITEAVMKQMQKVSYVYPGMVTDARAELGKKLAEIAPGNLTKTFFTLGGAEAIENAMKLARLYTGRHKIVANYRSYHGASYGAMSVSGDPRRFPMDAQQIPNVIRVENPYFYRCPWNSRSFEECGEMALRNLEQVLVYENPDSVAAILMEGESGSSGCLKYPPFYLKRVKEICDKYGILFICDETMSGFGRTGKMFAVEHHDTTPAVSCAAAVENIKILEEEKMVENAAEMGKYMEQRVEELKEKHPSIGDFRNTGLLGCIELVRNRKTKEPVTPWNAKPADMDVTNKMLASVKESGMFTFVRWNWIFTAPPLCVTKDQIDEGLEIISKAISIADKTCN
jgi:taurine---2-oxoglutarate transaminase